VQGGIERENEEKRVCVFRRFVHVWKKWGDKMVEARREGK
jgi:hypothetical protein